MCTCFTFNSLVKKTAQILTQFEIPSKATEIKRWHLYSRKPLSSFVYGRMILIGDAAHPILPFAAQGANAALEDAGALLCLFKDIKSVEQLPHRIQIFDEIRRMRASRIQTISTVPPGSQLSPDTQARLEEFATEDDMDGSNYGDLALDAVKYVPEAVMMGDERKCLTRISGTTCSGIVKKRSVRRG